MLFCRLKIISKNLENGLVDKVALTLQTRGPESDPQNPYTKSCAVAPICNYLAGQEERLRDLELSG